jgi:hypothetical protein
MADYYIFGFGLLVTLIVGWGLAVMIVANNRALEREEQGAVTRAGAAPVPAVVRDRSRD